MRDVALGVVVVVGGLMAATSSQSVPDVIQAKKFEVVNDEGKVVAWLGTDENGGDLRISNNDETPVAVIDANEKGMGTLRIWGNNVDSNVGVRDVRPLPVIFIRANNSGGSIWITDDKEKPVVGLQCINGNGVVASMNDKGEITGKLGFRLDKEFRR